MFGSIDKEANEANNSKVNNDLHSTKAKAEPVKKDTKTQARNIGGNGLSLIGQVATLIAGVGAAVAVISYLISALGMSVFTTIALMAGFGLAATLIGNKLRVDDWFLQLQGV